MPVPSLVSAADPRSVADVAPLSVARARASRGPLWPEALGELLWRGFSPLLFRFRRGWLYRQSFSGPVPDRILFQPVDPRPCRLEDADGLMRGRFRLAGQVLEIRDGSVFDVPLPNAEFAAALHGFEWLRHLEAADGELARACALKLAQQWLKRYARLTQFVWSPEIVSERLLNLFAHGRFFLVNTDLVWRSRFFVCMRDQACMLARMIDESQDGVPRIKAAAALALAGICLGDTRNVTFGLKRLSHELARQIHSDGGHVSRSPDALAETCRVVGMLRQTLESAQLGVPPALQMVLERMASMLRFLRMGDGGLAVFHGGGESDPRLIAALLQSDDAQSRLAEYAPQSAFQRLASGRTIVILDVGPVPEGAFSVASHASCLAFEMCSNGQRLIVSCGTAPVADSRWDAALRSTAASSTLVLNDTSSASLLQNGRLAKLLGRRLIRGPTIVETRRSETGQGIFVAAQHDGYASQFGILHQRRLMLSPRGAALSGIDRLIPQSRKPRRAALSFAIRFHIHPDVRLSLAQGGSVILKLPSGQGWRFRCGGELAIEESIYFGGGTSRRAEQLVVIGAVAGEPVECVWKFEQVGND